MSSFDEMDAFEGASLSARAMAVRPSPYLDELNPAQREAVEHLDGPVLMLAGAGTGKTKALTARIAHLLNTARARPNEILSVTFTNKAAREMKERVGRLLGQPAEGMPWLGTFHSICVKLLRRHAELVDLKSNFTILDSDDQKRLLKQLTQAANIDDKRWPARLLASIIDDWKNRALTPDKVPSADAGAYNNKGIELYAQYQTRLRELNAVDFGDLLLHMVTIFQTHPDVLEQYQRWFRYILVDEYQDTNIAQYLWLRLLAGGHKNICCVGDDDQSIYGWRGAEVGNILRFEKDFPGAYVVRLEQNYRSTPHILAAASNVIRGNENRLGKELWTDAEDGHKVNLIGHWDAEEEARWICEEIDAMQTGTRGMRPFELEEIAIMVRATHQMKVLEDRFLKIGMPYRVIGGVPFYRRLEIRDAIAYFRVVVSPDNDLAFERIVNTPKRSLGEKAQQTIQRIAREESKSLVESARIAVDRSLIKGKGAASLRELVEGLARWNALTRGPTIEIDDDSVIDDATGPVRYGTPELSHVELAQIILDESGYTESFLKPLSDEELTMDPRPPRKPRDHEAAGRLENLKELVNHLGEFENLQGFLEHVSLVMDNEQDGDEPKVSIMTLHASKGSEYPAVFLSGWEEGLFPSQRSMDEAGLKGLEEERRLAYVGITRAEEVCTISFASNRLIFSGDFKGWQSMMPSRFIDELPEEHVEVLTPPGLYGGGHQTAGIESRAAEANVYNSPGWKRMQARQGQYGMSQPRESRNTVIDATALASFTLGERVFHQKFGYGAVIGIEGDKVEVDFDKAGTKKVVSRFLTNKDDVPF
ncbi:MULTISPECIES: ATP-dependent helicase [unclassified Ruegeria]|uniref:ATP-dependent helicase n=1 Tax=unclassified Ruegeria TaxID=2625375 RepID=UPI0014899D34|nr:MULTISPECIES: UvrD-helicase domain-containing protein [unclassified Ruegeria]NOD34703.1 UvrD-helicase domain-containing protein [Ruegeria sp. HKCCD7296]NOE41827.1 UvrD-helicase domain-containing protein [Ruegeria sp. HKCCD7319]